METFVHICQAASDDTLSELEQHLTALTEILDPCFNGMVQSPTRHCFTYLALHTIDAIVSDEVIRRQNAREEARKIAARYLELEFPEPEEGVGAPVPTTTTSPKGKQSKIHSV